jgi:hypothetical protein
MAMQFSITIPDPHAEVTPELIPGGKHNVKGSTFAEHYAKGGVVPVSLHTGESRKLFAASRVVFENNKFKQYNKLNTLRLQGAKTGKIIAVFSDAPFLHEYTAQHVAVNTLILAAMTAANSRQEIINTAWALNAVIPFEYTEVVNLFRQLPSRVEIPEDVLKELMKSSVFIMEESRKYVHSRWLSAKEAAALQRELITARMQGLVKELSPRFTLIHEKMGV